MKKIYKFLRDILILFLIAASITLLPSVSPSYASAEVHHVITSSAQHSHMHEHQHSHLKDQKQAHGEHKSNIEHVVAENHFQDSHSNGIAEVPTMSLQEKARTTTQAETDNNFKKVAKIEAVAVEENSYESDDQSAKVAVNVHVDAAAIIRIAVAVTAFLFGFPSF